jgi:hypothetical protein
MSQNTPDHSFLFHHKSEGATPGRVHQCSDFLASKVFSTTPARPVFVRVGRETLPEVVGSPSRWCSKGTLELEVDSHPFLATSVLSKLAVQIVGPRQYNTSSSSHY